MSNDYRVLGIPKDDGILWFWIASLFALYRNYRYGDPEVRVTNIFLFSYFIAKIILFLIVFGGLYVDMQVFIGIIGLNISINGGIRRRALKSVPVTTELQPAPMRPRLQPSFQQ